MRLTTAQAIVRFLGQQYTERDGQERRFIPGCWGIFGHGNVAGIGQALQQERSLRYFLTRNEQAGVHAAAGFARMTNRLQTFACTSSIGPGATNMLTAAAGATINRLPVLLLPGDLFASRAVDPALQQLESTDTPDVSVNDAFRPISRYWDRIERPEQAISSLLSAMRVLTSPVETGAVTLALPEDVQAEAFDYPSALFEKRVWHISRPRPDAAAVAARGRMDSRQPATDHRRRWRRDLQRRERRPGSARRADRHSGRRDAGRQGLAALRPRRRASERSARPAASPPTSWRATRTW